MAEQDTQYGGFWIRFLAYLVDSAILFLAGSVLLTVAAFAGLAAGPAVMTIVFAAYVLLMLLYWPLMHASARQATFGKALLGLKVTGYDGRRISLLRSIGRFIATFVSGAVLLLGYIVAGFTRRKQALHDLIASTYVVREGRAHVLGALVAVIAAFALPVVVLPLLVGGAMMAVVSGMTAGALMSQPQPAKPAARPAAIPVRKPAAAPQKPAPAATAASAAEVDRLLTPLAGFDRPNSTRAGPAVLELSTFFAGNEPRQWIRVHLPPAQLAASVVVKEIVDAGNQKRFDPANKLESEFFQSVQLRETRDGVRRLEGLRSVTLMPGTTEAQVHRVQGVLKLAVPVGISTLSYRGADAGKDQESGGVKMTLTSLKGADAAFSFTGPRARVLEFRGFDAKGARVEQGSASWSGGASGSTHRITYKAPVERVEVAIAADVANREFPFTLARSSGAPAAPASPAPVAAPAQTLAAQAAARPAEAPQAAPKPSVSKPKRASKPKSAARPLVAAAPAPELKSASSPRFNDLMTAVLYRDAESVRELIALGKWPDKPDSSGATPLVVAVRLGDAPTAEALLRGGASAGRALGTAQARGDGAMLELLGRYGVR